MDGLPTLSSPKGDASGSKMSALDAAVRAGVGSITNSGDEAASPARDKADITTTGTDDHDVDAGSDLDAGQVDGHKPSDKDAAPSGSDTGSAADEASLAAPKVWPKEQRELFAKAPDEVKKLLLARERHHNSSFTKNATENATHRKFSEEVRGLFTPEARQTMQANGIDEMAAIKRLVGFHDRLTRDPAGEIKALMGRLGLKPEQLLGKTSSAADPATPEDEEFVDPYVKKLESKVGTIENFIVRALQDQQTQALTSLEQEFVVFESDKDEAGQPKYPHLDVVYDSMLHLMKSDPAISAMPVSQARQKLERAYETAVYLNPEVRKLVIDADFARRTARDPAKEAAARAKAAGTRKGSPGANGSGAVPAKLTLDQAVKLGVGSLSRS